MQFLKWKIDLFIKFPVNNFFFIIKIRDLLFQRFEFPFVFVRKSFFNATSFRFLVLGYYFFWQLVIGNLLLLFLVANTVLRRLLRLRGVKTGLVTTETITATYGGEAPTR